MKVPVPSFASRPKAVRRSLRVRLAPQAYWLGSPASSSTPHALVPTGTPVPAAPLHRRGRGLPDGRAGGAQE